MVSPFYHFSVDDVFDALIEVSDNRLDLFEHPFFAFLRNIHEEFGTKVDLYLFFRKNINGVERTLCDVSARNKAQFENAPWLRMGPHALDYDVPPHLQSPAEQCNTFDAIYAEIARFAGEANTSQWLRLHYFSEAYELSGYFDEKGVETLLLTDKEVAAYRLPERQRKQLKEAGRLKYAGMNLLRSSLRVENLVEVEPSQGELHHTIDSTMSAYGYFALFTHEIDMRRAAVQEQTLDCLKYLFNRQLYCV